MSDPASPPVVPRPLRNGPSPTFRGFWMTTAVALGLIGLAALVRPAPKVQDLGVLLFVLLVPATAIVVILTLFPRIRGLALGMLLGCGVLLLFSFALCSVHR